MSFFKYLIIEVFLLIFSNSAPLNLPKSVVQRLSIKEKKIVVCDKLALKKVSEDKKFGNKLKDLFGNVSYKTKRIILDRLIVNCINKITESQTKDYLKSLIEDSPIFVRTKKIEELLKYEYHLKNEPNNFLKQRLEITNILNKLYHPNTNPIVNEETIKQEYEEKAFFDKLINNIGLYRIKYFLIFIIVIQLVVIFYLIFKLFIKVKKD
jgi:hypothetical protein